MLLCRQFGFTDMTSAALTGSPARSARQGALLGYIKETQKFDISHINRLDVFYGGRYMEA